jgi:hypothetical protein
VPISTYTGNYLVADQRGGADLMAYSTWARGWETFQLQDLTQSTLTDGDVVTLQGGQGQWASAVNGGGGVITVTAPWQRGCPTEVQDRVSYYLSFCNLLGVSPGSGALSC